MLPSACLRACAPAAQNKIQTYEDKTGELQEVLNFKQDELEKKKVIIRKLDMELVKVVR